MIRRPPRSPLFPYPTLSQSRDPSTQKNPPPPPQRWRRPCSAQAVLHCSFLALSIQQNHHRADHAVLQTATRTCSRPPSTHSLRASPQRGGRCLDQISIGSTRGPRFSATQVSP